MKEFKGRVIAKGAFIGEAKVTHEGFNTLASFQKSALLNKKELIILQSIIRKGYIIFFLILLKEIQAI